MLKIGASYYDALDDNDGSQGAVRRRLRAPRERYADHGQSAAGEPGGIASTGALGCKAQLDTGTFQYIDKIDNRRVASPTPRPGS